jgi:hypothetical protein
MAWYLNQALTNFRNEVNATYPRRDKASDGTIGDPAHAARTSDHNPDADGSVDAWDMDVEVNGAGVSFINDVEHLKELFQAHEASSYWIHNDEICRRTDGWVRKSYAYAGPSRNRHTQHVHWNTREAYEDSTKPWGVEDDMDFRDGGDGEALIYRLSALVTGAATVQGGPTKGERVALNERINGLTQGLSALSARVEALGQAEAQRDTALRTLLERHNAGTITAEAVVARMGELLSGQE